MKRFLLLLLAFLVLLVGLALPLLPAFLDGSANRVVPPAVEASPEGRALHASLRVVDLHADPLLWRRDLLDRHDRGHVDLPRLREGNVAVQVFGVATKAPLGMNYELTRADALDMLTVLSVVQAWPPATWGSLLERALHQAALLEDAAARSQGGLVLLRSRADLEALLARRAAGEPVVGAMLGLEGLHALEGDLASVDRLFDAGYRMMGLTHFFDNEAAGSSAGEAKHGLTELGRQVIRRMEERGIAVDLAHTSPRSIDDVLAMATRPVVVSHTGVQAICPGPRNLSDHEVIRVAENGGVIGIGTWDGAVCDTSPAAIARSMRHVRDLVGARHVALGSDFDGGVATRFDVAGLAVVAEALVEIGFSEQEVRLAMGENALRVLAATLPEAAD